MSGYVFDNDWEREQERLASLEAAFDPGTFRHLEALGVGPGWRCLEAGAGRGSVARWLCRRVGPEGRVVATDLKPRFLEALEEPNLEVWRHDIVADELPEAEFELVHARFLLEHLPGREGALKKMPAALRPGGWILVEDMEWSTVIPLSARGSRVLKRVMSAARRILELSGYDGDYGRKLPGQMAMQGLIDIGGAGRFGLVRGGPDAPEWLRLSAEEMRGPGEATGLLSGRDIDRLLELLDDPEFAFFSFSVVAVWGRRPGGDPA